MTEIVSFFSLAIVLLFAVAILFKWASERLKDFRRQCVVGKILMTDLPSGFVVEGLISHRKIHLERKELVGGRICFVPDSRELINEDGSERLPASAEIVGAH